MKKLFAMMALGLLTAGAPVRAAGNSLQLEEQFKSALNRVVQDVRRTDDPSSKREILAVFFDRMDGALAKAQGVPSLSEQDKRTLADLRKSFRAYDADLAGSPGHDRVADADLDQFAGFVQQDMEQAAIGGGIYISAGAAIVILILLLLLIR